MFVDGRCLDECPQNTIEVFQTETICVRDPNASSTIGDDGMNDGLPIFEIDIESAQSLTPCRANNCQACGLSSDYCTMCENGFVRSGGKCVDSCGDGYFKADGVCFKCNPMCATCSKTAN